jgi:hypothetical protein
MLVACFLPVRAKDLSAPLYIPHCIFWYDIFINCNWVVTRWQYTFTHIIRRTTQITTNVEECGPCPVLESFTLVFALQLRKRHGKTSVRVRKTSVRVQYTYYQNIHTLQNLHKHTQYNPPPTHTHTHTHTHTLQNNIKPPQYKLKQTQYKIYPNPGRIEVLLLRLHLCFSISIST